MRSAGQGGHVLEGRGHALKSSSGTTHYRPRADRQLRRSSSKDAILASPTWKVIRAPSQQVNNALLVLVLDPAIFSRARRSTPRDYGRQFESRHVGVTDRRTGKALGPTLGRAQGVAARVG